MIAMFSSFLLAAALGLNPNNKVISPGLGTRVVVRTQAFLVDSEPGEFSVEAFLNADGDVPGEKIENVRVTPPNQSAAHSFEDGHKVTISIF